MVGTVQFTMITGPHLLNDICAYTYVYVHVANEQVTYTYNKVGEILVLQPLLLGAHLNSTHACKHLCLAYIALCVTYEVITLNCGCFRLPGIMIT